ncbi:MAG: hypothetical protein HYT29_00585 [Parcubacteria group bacterium]|nr:hypothetical protein [Parcubacteria group bacterium]
MRFLDFDNSIAPRELRLALAARTIKTKEENLTDSRTSLSLGTEFLIHLIPNSPNKMPNTRISNV